MEVMNGGEFDQTNVLIGQTGKTQGYSVTNDPVLMSMLSTGFYGNPLRTMIQEVMFNAWDAHRIGKCKDKPIDIHINETSGLIIRDFGPGISPADMHPVYCVYGGSTKRDDSEATGGFGLGSKSPYSYTDSFSVTTHHKNLKSMYIMQRSHEDNNGGPGMTQVIDGIQTDQTGLSVVVPLKNPEDRRRAYRYIKDVLYLSGIKARVHYGTEEDGSPKVETFIAEEIPPGEFYIDNDVPTRTLGREPTAIYGGVRYEIPNADAYLEEMAFLKQISDFLGQIFISFHPNTLTPLPNREGLNMNDLTTETIKSQLELIQDTFQQIITPAVRSTMLETLTEMRETGIQFHFVGTMFKQMQKTSARSMVDDHERVLQAIQRKKPPHVSDSMWTATTKAIFHNTPSFVKLLGREKWRDLQYKVWCQVYPEHRNLRNTILEIPSRHDFDLLLQQQIRRSVTDLIQAHRIATKAADAEVSLRLNSSRNQSNDWLPITNVRRGGKFLCSRSKAVALNKEGKVKKPTDIHTDSLWFTQTGDGLDEMLMYKTVIVAKTLGSLKDTSFKFQSIFCPNHGGVQRGHPYHMMNWLNSYRRSTPICGAMVIKKTKNSYDNAVEALKAAGWNVIEADEPDSSYVPLLDDQGNPFPTTKKGPVTYPEVDFTRGDWSSENVEYETPTTFMKTTQTEINGYYGPARGAVRYVMEKGEKVVTILSANRVGRLERMGAKSIEDRVEDYAQEMVQNPLFETVLLEHKFTKHDVIHYKILRHPLIRAFLGIPVHTDQEYSEIDSMISFYNEIRNNRGRTGVSYRAYSIVDDVVNVFVKSPSFSSVLDKAETFKVFNRTEVTSVISNYDDTKMTTFVQNMITFLNNQP